MRKDKQKRTNLKSQKCHCAWYSHISSQFVMVKQAVQMLHKDFHNFQSSSLSFMSLAHTHSDINACIPSLIYTETVMH